jgi:hypothetical protein
MYNVLIISGLLVAFVASIVACHAIQKKILETSSSGDAGCLPVVVAVIVFLAIVILVNSISDPFKPEKVIISDTSSIADPLKPRRVTISDTQVTFTSASNGHDWRRADQDTKRKYCERMATTMSQNFKRNFTADFFMGALMNSIGQVMPAS